jgi:poly(A) polymerase Pap1
MRSTSIRLLELVVVIVTRRVRISLTYSYYKGHTLLLLFPRVSLYLGNNSPVLIVQKFGQFLSIYKQEVSIILRQTTFLSQIGYRLDP